MSECPICESNNQEDLEEEILQGIPKTLLAEDLGCDVEDIVEHMEEHRVRADENVDYDETYNDSYMKRMSKRDSYKKFDVLDTNMKRLTDRFDVILEKDGWDKEETDQIVSIAREVRQTAMAMAKLEGEIKQELELTQKQFEELKGAILNVLDKENRQKILNFIDEETELVAEE